MGTGNAGRGRGDRETGKERVGLAGPCRATCFVDLFFRRMRDRLRQLACFLRGASD